MGVDEVIDESQHCFFYVVHANSLRVHVEREAIISLDAHEVVVKVEYWEQ